MTTMNPLIQVMRVKPQMKQKTTKPKNRDPQNPDQRNQATKTRKKTKKVLLKQRKRQQQQKNQQQSQIQHPTKAIRMVFKSTMTLTKTTKIMKMTMKKKILTMTKKRTKATRTQKKQIIQKMKIMVMITMPANQFTSEGRSTRTRTRMSQFKRSENWRKILMHVKNLSVTLR